MLSTVYSEEMQRFLKVGCPVKGKIPLSANEFRFTDLDLFTSMARVAVRSDMTTQEAWAETASVFLRFHRHLETTSSLHWKSSYGNYYKDSEKTNVSGRFGDALGALYMDRLGFPLFCHFEDITIDKPATGALPTKRPDFVFFNDSLRASRLLECKGSSVSGAPGALVKRVKDDAMKGQIVPWLGLQICFPSTTGLGLPYRATTGWAVGTFITPSKSWLYPMQSDPLAHASSTTYTASSDVVRRHYLRWLKMMGTEAIPEALMGLPEAQEFLRNQRLSFLEFSFAGTTYLSPLSPFRFNAFSMPFTTPPTIPTLMNGELSFVRLGLEERRMRLLLSAARASNLDGQLSSLLELVGDGGFIDGEGELQERPFESDSVSIFGDGSIAFLLGEQQPQFQGVVEI